MSRLAELFRQTFALIDDPQTSQDAFTEHYIEVCRHAGVSTPLIRKLEAGQELSDNEEKIIKANIIAGGRREALRIFDDLINTARDTSVSWKDFKKAAYYAKDTIPELTDTDFADYIESKNGYIHKIDENRWQNAFEERMDMPRPRRTLKELMGGPSGR